MTENSTHNSIDLAQCDLEKVQFCGAIMPHGVMIIIDPSDQKIQAISANASEQFGCQITSDSTLQDIFSPELTTRINHKLDHHSKSLFPQYIGRFNRLNQSVFFDIFAHHSDKFLIIEFENVLQENNVNLLDSIQVKPSCAEISLQQAQTWQQSMQIAVDELRQMNGFNTVLGMQILHDGSSQTIAESYDGVFPSFLDKRFPASDIPRPGRRQLQLLPIQYSPLMDYEPVPLIPLHAQFQPQDIDLTYTQLRSPSPMCRRFYLNVGVQSRTVFSILKDNTLWGYFVCWNAHPKYLNIFQRSYAQSFASLSGQLIVEKEKSQRHKETLNIKLIISRLISDLTLNLSLKGWQKLVNNIVANMDIAGVIIDIDTQKITAGQTPHNSVLTHILNWLKDKDSFYVTDQLELDPPTHDYDKARGLVAMQFPDVQIYVLLFRPEWVNEVLWAGDPRKPVVIDPESGGERLTARGSFETWCENVRGKSRPWEAYEIHAFKNLQHEIYRVLQNEKMSDLLLETTSWYKTIIESTSDAIIGKDFNHKIISWNNGAERIYGYKAKEVIGADIKCLSFEDKEDTSQNAYPLHSDYHEEKRRTKQGKAIKVSISESMVINPKGKQTSASIEISRDITQQKRLEEQFHDNLSQLQHAEKIAHLGSWIYHLPTDQLNWSNEVYRIFGLSQNFEPSYAGFLTLCHPDDQDRVKQVYENSLRFSQESYEIEHQIIRPSTGEIRDVHQKCIHIRNQDDKIIRSIGMIQDITERKQAERLLKYNEASLQRLNTELGLKVTALQKQQTALQRYQSLIESTSDAVICKNLDGIVQTWNKGAEELFGYAAEEIIGLPITKLFPQEHLKEELQIIEQIRHGSRVSNYNTTRKHKEGHFIHVSITISPIVDDRKEIIGASTILRDISEQIRSQSHLEITKQRFENLFNNAPIALCFINENGKIIDSNIEFQVAFDKVMQGSDSILTLWPDDPEIKKYLLNSSPTSLSIHKKRNLRHQ